MPKLPALPFIRGSADPSPDAAEGAVADVAATDDRHHRLLGGMAVAGAAVLLLLGYLLVGRSTASAPVSTLVAGGGGQQSTPVMPQSGTPSPSAPGIDVPQDVVARDPFEVLYPNGTTSGSTGSTGSTDGTGTGSGSGSGAQLPDNGSGTSGSTTAGSTIAGSTTTPASTPSSTPAPTPTSTTTPTPSATKHTSIMLVGTPTVYGSTYRATFQVDGSKLYTVNVGATFGGSLQFLSVHSDITGMRYATVRYAKSTPFDIAAGYTVRLSG
jgi:hypothetical protein